MILKNNLKMNSLGDVRLFALAAGLGSLSAAGKQLGLSPAAASARLTKLEATLGARLFERTTRQLRLTDEGSLYLEHCRQALQALDDGQAALRAGRAEMEGKLRVAATSDFGRHVLKPWLDEFCSLHPGVKLGLVLSDHVSNLFQEDIDVAIRFGELPESSLVARRLASNRRVLCASPAFLAKHGEPRHPRDLAKYDCIILGVPTTPTVEWRFERDGIKTSYLVPLADSADTNDGAIARAWAIDGRGLVMKSQWDIGEDVLAGRLIPVMQDWRTPEVPVHAVMPRGQYMPRRVRALLDFVVSRFAEFGRELERVMPGVHGKAGARSGTPRSVVPQR
jgi:DNA-binding transcriptional LysR family regulator